MTINAPTTDSDASTLTERVVDSAANVTGADPLDLPPLYEAVDPDALAALYDRDGDGPRVEFAYAGCGVTIRGDGSVSVTPEPIDVAGSTVTDGISSVADGRADAHQDC